jgi:hypothetical protein
MDLLLLLGLLPVIGLSAIILLVVGILRLSSR